MKPVVYIRSLQKTWEGRARQFNAASSAIGLSEAASNAGVVFIKPNLTFPTYKQGVTTRAEFVEELVTQLLLSNPRLKILIGEGEGGYNSFSMSQAMKAMGYEDIAARHRQVEIVNLSRVPSRTVEISTSKGPYLLDLPDLFFTDVDFSISVPLAKVHCMTKVTLSLKNLWGCLPDVMRLKNHYMFPELIFRIASLMKFTYAFLDGKYGLDTNGPMDGDVVEIDWFAASNSLGAFDLTVSEMMGFDWRSVPYLRTAGRHGFVPPRGEIQVDGDIQALGRTFVLKRTAWNYPALAAFHSRSLTHLFYFSRWAGFMHDVMYTFRKRSILQ